MKTLISTIIFTLIFLHISSPTHASSPPEGSLDLVDGTSIAGWAKDIDFNGPILIHIFVDGDLVSQSQNPSSSFIVKAPFANKNRPDVGDHAFHWIHSPLGYGPHTIRAYAIGVDSTGSPDGQSTELINSPKQLNLNCERLVGNELEWCQNTPNYWITRQNDTKLIWNDYLKIGINNSYGGLITQLYNQDDSFNLIEEHGGSAVQISIYGYDTTNPDKRGAWFGRKDNVPGYCDATRYETETACLVNNDHCRQFGAAYGAHVANCVNVLPCNNTEVGWPLNPIQAQGVNCSWEDPSNNVSSFSQPTNNSWQITNNNFSNYSKSSLFPGLNLTQTVTLEDAYVKLDYQLNYSGPYTLDPHPQEFPAVFTAENMRSHYYYYNGSQPYTNFNSSVITINNPPPNNRILKFPEYQGIHQDNFDTATEHWWGACNQDESHCLTVATFDTQLIQRAYIKTLSAGGSYLTPLAEVGFKPGDQYQFTVYLFPYKWNQIVNGKTIREHIYNLRGNPTPLPGDANADGLVNTADYTIWANHYPQSLSSPANGDFNQDNQVNGIDYTIWLNNFAE